jgi:5'-methylthioadenosine phosphorylase
MTEGVTDTSRPSLLGIIGGSGIYELDQLKDRAWRHVSTPFGEPSDELLFGTLDGQPLVFLPRHGRGHRLAPGEINYRANLAALKSVGVTDVLSLSAVGSLREGLPPGTFVLVDQFIDRTFARPKSFFGDGVVSHVSMASPTCARLHDAVEQAAKTISGIRLARGGTYLAMEGPQFSTLAESKLYQSWGCDVIGMTAMPEAKLAREAELCYVTLAMVTDFDCWHPDHAQVTVADVVRVMTENAQLGRSLVQGSAPLLKQRPTHCPNGCDRALETAVMTAPAVRPVRAISKLLTVAGRVLQREPAPGRPTFAEYVKSRIRTIPDFPKPGIQFRDVTTLMKDGPAFKSVIQTLADRYRDAPLQAIAGIEARGLIFGAALAHELGLGFVPVRKRGKLPGATLFESYGLEYGKDEVEIHADAVQPGDRVLVVDDLLATGGTAEAAIRLLKRVGARISGACFVVELPDLGGRTRLEEQGCPVVAVCAFEGH